MSCICGNGAFVVGEMGISLRLLLCGVHHSSLWYATLWGACSDLGGGASGHCSLRNLHHFLLCLLNLNFFLFLPLVLHILVKRDRVILFLHLSRHLFGRSQTRNILILIRDFGTLSIQQITILHKLILLFNRIWRLSFFGYQPSLRIWSLRLNLPYLLGSNIFICCLAQAL